MSQKVFAKNLQSPVSLHVEMFGPMGSGKSTIYRKVVGSKGWRRMGGTVRAAVVEKTLLLQREARERSVLYGLSMGMLSRIPALKSSLVVDKITSSAWNSMAARSSEWYGFIQHVLNRRLKEQADVQVAMRRIQWFIRDLSDRALFDEFAESRFLLHDESLLQRGLGLSFDTEEGDSFFGRYVQLFPAPVLVIFVSVPVDVAKERVAKRQRGNHEEHVRDLSKAHFRSRLAVDWLRHRGVSVLHLDGLCDPKENAKECLKVLHILASQGMP